MRDSETILAEQFDDLQQQEEASTLGMWTFLATEILFFGGLFIAYMVYRGTYPEAFAKGSSHANVLLGTINTAVLLTSSLTMAFAVHWAQRGDIRRLIRHLGYTALLGIAFLGVKALEYHQHISHQLLPGPSFRQDLPPETQLFFWLYFVLTGLHALHVLIGIGLLLVMAWLARNSMFSSRYFTPVEASGLYWHFVDIVWVFLYPLFYLIR